MGVAACVCVLGRGSKSLVLFYGLSNEVMLGTQGCEEETLVFPCSRYPEFASSTLCVRERESETDRLEEWSQCELFVAFFF